MTLSVRCFHLLSSMCQTSEIDGRCVHLRGSDRCEISYAATLAWSIDLRGSDRCEISYAATFAWSMCRSTFEDPIDVNFIIMLLHLPKLLILQLYANGPFHLSKNI